jgi:benzoate-CoA ligase family protein
MRRRRSRSRRPDVPSNSVRADRPERQEGSGVEATARPEPSERPYNAAVDLLERNLAPGRANALYVRTGRESFTFADVSRAADAAGLGLLELGLRPGDRVVLATRDRLEFVAAFWGGIKAGLIPVPVTPDLSRREFTFILHDSGAKSAICDASSVGALLPAAGTTPVLFVGRGKPREAQSWELHCTGSASMPPAPTGPDDIALWLYTSGTTGKPKAAMHRHRHLRDAPRALAEQVIGLGPDDIVLSVSKMFFAYGLGNAVYLPAAAGASVVVNEGPAIPPRVQYLLAAHRPTVLFGVPTFLRGFVDLDEADPPDTVRIAISAGESLPSDLFDRFRRRFGITALDGLGTTEALHHVTSNRPDDVTPGSAGYPLRGYGIQVLDRNGEPVPEGRSGELWVRGPTTFVGYWHRPSLTERVYREDWMRTGDLVHVREGRLYHEGRLGDLLKLGGVWVAPNEVEEVLCAHPDVVDAAVVARDDAAGVPGISAFVVSARRDRQMLDELSRLCRNRLARFKVPAVIKIVDELPRTPTGKLRRFVLRERRGTACSE